MASLIYPVVIVGGDIALTTDEIAIATDAVESSIRTRQGERVLRPDYGRAIEPFSLISNLGAISQSLRNSIITSTEDYNLGKLSVLSGYAADDGQVSVDVKFDTPSGDGYLETKI